MQKQGTFLCMGTSPFRYRAYRKRLFRPCGVQAGFLLSRPTSHRQYCKNTPPSVIGGVNYGNACKGRDPSSLCSVGTVGRRPQGPKAMTSTVERGKKKEVPSILVIDLLLQNSSITKGCLSFCFRLSDFNFQLCAGTPSASFVPLSKEGQFRQF